MFTCDCWEPLNNSREGAWLSLRLFPLALLRKRQAKKDARAAEEAANTGADLGASCYIVTNWRVEILKNSSARKKMHISTKFTKT